ncbi:antitoxin CcdA [Sphingomonas jinjuensis]|uniref:Antitoxin CcdA n=1 Tax=Sphingomonas jinjuensis TaxID=535907 RepID=A0A840F7U8_9SPHN|nr:type II toxin-antitoxin system CcdA family antitoxin [Sphingomonas jinjuensis]MBB4152386.1 antitoxin CcdA [Sphingomonas jinjuensis]
MKHDPIRTGKRKAVNVSIDTGIVAAAKEAGVNMSRIAEDAIRAAVKIERGRQWAEENREAMEGWNRWYEKNGHPLEAYKLI